MVTVRRLMAAGMAAGAVSAVLAAGGIATASVTASGPTWGRAQQVPGLAALNQRGAAEVTAVSCSAPGDCGAGGFYLTKSGYRAFVVSQVRGRWQRAVEVPGLAALNKGGDAHVTSVSCAAPGQCGAGGFYQDAAHHTQAFVVSRVGGRWHRALEVPGSAALNTIGLAQVSSLSCPSAGSCTAGGYYETQSVPNENVQQAFVVSEVNGTWGQAEQVPGSAALNAGGGAQVFSVSCSSAGDCSVGGNYHDGAGQIQAFLAGDVHGIWRNAFQVPGTVVLNQGGRALVSSVSCPRAGNCSAVGIYTNATDTQLAFAVNEISGTWRLAQQVGSSDRYNDLVTVSCGSPGDCSAGGYLTDRSGHAQAVIASEKNDAWGGLREVRRSGALNTGGFAEITSVSCTRAFSCSAGGYYHARAGRMQALVATEVRGTWGAALEVPGSAALNRGGFAKITSVSCARPGDCGAGGLYENNSGGQGLVVTESAPG